MAIVYINGEFLPAHEATVSVFDRGFLFADSVYEVIPVYQGRLLFLKRHLRRLQASLEAIKMQLPSLDWQAIMRQLIEKNGSGDMQLYVQVTRGNEGKRKHDIPKAINPTIVLFSLHNDYPDAEHIKKGLKAILLEDYRWQRCNIKTTALLANVLLNDDAIQQGGETTLLIRDGYLTEGSTSNIFMVDKTNKLRTPPLNNLCLPGITREIVLEIARDLGWSVLEEPIAVEELMQARELWLTSTTKEIYPITSVGAEAIGDGKAGPFWQQMFNHFKQLISEDCHG